MQTNGSWRATVLVAALAALLTALSACGSAEHGGGGAAGDRGVPARSRPGGPAAVRTTGLPGVGEGLRRRIPADSGQAVVVYGRDKDSADATLVLYTRRGSGWERTRGWPAHNGKKGWTVDHHLGDNRSPVGVYTLSDAGGVLADPGAGLPYTRDESFAAPRQWHESHWHDFDYVIAIDYNRVKGTPPNDPTRPEGAHKGGGIWLHMDHGSGTSACVSVAKEAMEYLLRTLDPARHPVIVMGDRADLTRSARRASATGSTARTAVTTGP
ncbi:L,D-transpeptidase family protein [Streptomyces sp. NPDC004542]|uniref:L,D-transpeptidase family protein n=1 Tax=Streptomyces sp. NPDC004542 TaxID=3154281 RepID=UPI0033B9343D